MAAISLEELLGNVKAYQKGSEEATQQVLAALDTQEKLSNANADTFKQQATDDTTIQEAKNAAEFATQLSRVKAANALGTNLKSSSEVITGLASAAQDAYTRKDAALKAIQEKDSINFLDHPVDYIVAQFTRERDVAAHNIANAQLRAAETRINAINQNTQQTIITQNAISEPLTAASMEASARSAAVAATVNARNAQIQGLSYGTRGIEFALNAKKEVLGLMFQTKQAANAEEHLALAQKGYELQVKSFEQQQYEFEQRRNDRQEQLALGQSVLDTVNLGRTALLGDKAAPLDDMAGKMILATLKGKGTLSAEMQKYYDAGERTKLMGHVVVGTTPSAAAETLQTVPVQLNPTQGAIKNLLQQAATDTSTAIKNSELPGQNKNPVFVGIDKKDKNSVNAAYNGRAQQLLNEAAKVVKPGDGDNPYQIASINQLAVNSPTIQALPVYKKVLEPLVRSGVHLSDPKQVMQVVGDAVAKGTITHAQAIDLTTIYHVGVAANISMRNFEGFGLKPKYSYNAQITTDPDAWHSDEVVNMTDPMAVSRALLKLKASTYRNAMAEGGVNIFSGKSNNQNTQIFNGNWPSLPNMPSIPSHFGPPTNYPASEEQMKKADRAYSEGWDKDVNLRDIGIRRTSYER
jgi:hypothetical protein